MAAILLFDARFRRKQRVFRDRTLDGLSEEEVVSRYRLDRGSIEFLEGVCREDLSPQTNRTMAIPCITKILIGLRYMAKGDFLSEVGDLHGVSKATASLAVADFVHSINRRLDNIRFPTDRHTLQQMKLDFYNKCRIPNVIGAVDGTLIPILAPSADEAAFVFRKGFHALNVQGVCDQYMRFTNIVSMWPGSQHDSAIFNACGLKTYLENNGVGMILGDSGYPLKRYLLTPKINPQTNQEQSFNTHHSRGRMVIERAFGMLKSRFRCLHKTGGVLPFEPGKSSQVIVACARLHNLCINRGLEEPEGIPMDVLDFNDDDNIVNDVENRNIRQEIINLF